VRQHVSYIVVDVAALVLLGSNDPDERVGDWDAHRVARCVETITPDRPQSLGAGDHAAQFALAAALRAAVDRPVDHPPPSVGVQGVWVEPLGLEPVRPADERTLLQVKLDGAALDVTRAVDEVVLNPVDHGPAQRGPGDRVLDKKWVAHD
jgi:hypothetical protein